MPRRAIMPRRGQTVTFSPASPKMIPSPEKGTESRERDRLFYFAAQGVEESGVPIRGQLPRYREGDRLLQIRRR
jgi:hypothetical protein